MHSFKRCLRILGAAVAVCLVLALLDMALYPCTFMRLDLHRVTTRTFDDIYLGTSHGKINIDPEAMEAVTGRTGHNLCVGGEYPIDTYYMAKLILETGHKPARIVYEISPGYIVGEKEEGNNYLLFYHEFPLTKARAAYFWDAIARCNFRTMLFPWYEYPLSYELGKVGQTLAAKLGGDYSVDDFQTSSQAYHESGFIERYAVDTSTLTTEGLLIPEVSRVVTRNMDYLEKLITLCRDNGIEFTAVTTPMPLAALQQAPANYSQMWEYFDAFFAEQGVTYLNFNDADHFNLFTHETPAFTDMDGHMNGDAARAFSRVLAQELA